jgi:predicted transcriptional regulator
MALRSALRSRLKRALVLYAHHDENQGPDHRTVQDLDQAQQREVAQQLYERAVVGSFYDRMTSQQLAELDEGIAQAKRGEVWSAEEVFDRIAKHFCFSAE